MAQETVLIHLRTNRVYVLNETATRLWELVGDGCDRDQIVERLLQEFDVDESHLRREIEATLSQLLKQDLLSESDAG